MSKSTTSTTKTLDWGYLIKHLPNVATYLRLSIQKLRLEYKDKEQLPKVWSELATVIGRRGALDVDSSYQVGCGANPTLRIDDVKHPQEAAKLKQLYAVPPNLMKQAEDAGGTKSSSELNLTLSVTGLPLPAELSDSEVQSMLDCMPNTKQRAAIGAGKFKSDFPACFRFMHRRSQLKALESKLDFMRDQTLAELADYQKEALALPSGSSLSIKTKVDGVVLVTLSMFEQPMVKLVLPETAAAQSFGNRLSAARKEPNAYLQQCAATGIAKPKFTPYGKLRMLAASKPKQSDTTAPQKSLVAV